MIILKLGGGWDFGNLEETNEKINCNKRQNKMVNGAESFVRPTKVRHDISATATLVRPQNVTFVRPDLSAT